MAYSQSGIWKGRACLALTTGLATVVWSAPSWGQAQATAPVAPATQEGRGDQSDGIGDIVVTAQRRSERLQDVPAAIAALDSTQLQSAGVVSTQDLQLVVPGLFFTQTVFSPAPTIRGIGTRGTNPGDEQVVPIYLDGVYQPFITGAIFELSNVERIEVLKGPQGTLLGRNATGGAINIITPDPSSEGELKLKLGYGSFNQREFSAYAAGGTETVAASLDVNYLADDGYVRDLNRGGHSGDLDSKLIRGKVKISPSENTDIILTASYSKRSDPIAGFGYAYQGNTIATRLSPTVLVAAPERRTAVNTNFDVFLNIRQVAASMTIKQNLGFADLTAISGYSDNKLSYQFDLDQTPLAVGVQNVVVPDKAFNQELYLTSTTEGPFSWIVGGFYFNDKAGFQPRVITTSSTLTLRSTTRTDAYAIYAQGAYELSPGLKITVGGRYSIDRRSYEAQSINPTGSIPLTATTFRKFNPSATIEYKASDSLMVYAKYATAYKSGLYNTATLSATPVLPESVKSWELGLKSDPSSWLRVNLSAFLSNYDNIQVQTRDPVTAASLLENAASARIYGVEGDFVIKPARRFNIRAGLSLIHSKYLSYTEAAAFVRIPAGGNQAITVDATGNRLARVPGVTANLGGDYTAPVNFGSITIGANMAYTGNYYWTADRRLPQDDYAMVNAQLSWRSLGGQYAVELWARNITNAQPPLTVSPSAFGDAAAYVRPRTVGVRLLANF